jgi:DNA-binding transcriptional regulator GbsR (MarR family)
MDDERLFRAVERFGTTLEGAGMPRMASRVFAYILAEDRETYTARDLTEGLGVSPAAISGAMKYLVPSGLVVKERQRGGRGDVFRVTDGDIWATIMAARVPLLEHFVTAVDDAVSLLDPGSPGRERLAETRDFFAFMMDDMTGMLERWQEHRAAGSDSATRGD